MGFMDFLNRARSSIGMGLARAGTVVRRIGDTSAPVIRKVGQVSGILSKVAPIVGAALAPATGGLSLGIGAAAGRALGAVSNVAGRAGDIAGKISSVGSKLQTIGQTVGGMPQGSQPYASPSQVMVARSGPVGMAGSGLPRR